MRCDNLYNYSTWHSFFFLVAYSNSCSYTCFCFIVFFSWWLQLQSGLYAGMMRTLNFTYYQFWVCVCVCVCVCVYMRVALKVMPHTFFSHSRIKIAMWKLRGSNTDVYCAHVSTWSSKREHCCSSLWKWRLCLTHVTNNEL